VAKLSTAIEDALRTALAATEDRVIRIDVPRTWPVPEAVSMLAADSKKGERLRVGILRPFTASPFTDIPCDVSIDAGQITRWRNERGRRAAIVVCGRADSQNTAGLRDFARIVRRADVMTAWKALEGETIAERSGKPEVGRLIEALFNQCEQGHLDALGLDDYLSAIAQVTPRQIESVFVELWRTRLIPDDQILDKGVSARRLDTNLEVIARLEAGEERDLRVRLRRASQGTDNKARSARAALDFMKTRSKDDLRGARLSDILDILGTRGAAQSLDRADNLIDLLNSVQDDYPGVARALRELTEKWSLDDSEGVVEAEATISGERRRYRLSLRPTTANAPDDEDSDEVLASLWVPQAAPEGQVLAAWKDTEEPELFDVGKGWKRRLASDFFAVLDAHTASDVAEVRLAFGHFVSARAALTIYEPWLSENAFELLVVKNEALEAVESYLASWEGLLRAALKLSSPGRPEPASSVQA
jgi:hypothetical protein